MKQQHQREISLNKRDKLGTRYLVQEHVGMYPKTSEQVVKKIDKNYDSDNYHKIKNLGVSLLEDHSIYKKSNNVRVNVRREQLIENQKTPITRLSLFGDVRKSPRLVPISKRNHLDTLDLHVLAYIDTLHHYVKTLVMNLELYSRLRLDYIKLTEEKAKRVVMGKYYKRYKPKKLRYVHPKLNYYLEQTQQSLYESSNFLDILNDIDTLDAESFVQRKKYGILSERILFSNTLRVAGDMDLLEYQESIDKFDYHTLMHKPILFRKQSEGLRGAKLYMKELFVIAKPDAQTVREGVGKLLHFMTLYTMSIKRLEGTDEVTIPMEKEITHRTQKKRRRPKKLKPVNKFAIMNTVADPEKVPYKTKLYYPKGDRGLDIYNDLLKLEGTITEYNHLLGYFKGIEYLPVEVLKDSENNPRQLRPGHVASGLLINEGGSLTRGFYYFSLLENLVQNEVLKREQFITIEQGTNDYDIELMYSPDPQDRVKRDRIIKIIVKGNRTIAGVVKQEVIKEVSLYLPEGVNVEIALAEVRINSDGDVNLGSTQQYNVLLNKKQLKALRNNKLNDWERNPYRNDNMLLSGSDKNASDQGKQILESIANLMNREKKQDAMWHHSNLYLLFTNFSTKRYVMFNSRGTVEATSTVPYAPKHTAYYYAKLYTPNQVSKKEKEMGYKQVGNMVERVQEISSFIGLGAYLTGGNKNYNLFRRPSITIDKLSEAPIIQMYGNYMYQDSQIYSDTLEGSDFGYTVNKAVKPINDKKRVLYKTLSRQSRKYKLFEKFYREGKRRRFPKTSRTRVHYVEPRFKHEVKSLTRGQIAHDEEQLNRFDSRYARHHFINRRKRLYKPVKKKALMETHHAPNKILSLVTPQVNNLRDYLLHPNYNYRELLYLKDTSTEDKKPVQYKKYVSTSLVSGNSVETFVPIKTVPSEQEDRDVLTDVSTWPTFADQRDYDEDYMFPNQSYKVRIPIRHKIRHMYKSSNHKQVGMMVLGTSILKGLRVSRDAVQYHLKVESYFGHIYQRPETMDPKWKPEVYSVEDCRHTASLIDGYDAHQEQRHILMEDIRWNLNLIHNNYEAFMTRLKLVVNNMKEEIYTEVNLIGVGYGACDDDYVNVLRTGSLGYLLMWDDPTLEVYEDEELEADDTYRVERDARREKQLPLEPMLQVISPSFKHEEWKAPYPANFAETPPPITPFWGDYIDYMVTQVVSQEVVEYRFKLDNRFQYIMIPEEFTFTRSTIELYGNKSDMSHSLQFKIAKEDYTPDVRQLRIKLVHLSPLYKSYGRYRVDCSDKTMLLPSGNSIEELETVLDDISNNVVYLKRPKSYKQLGKWEDNEHHKVYERKYKQYEDTLLDIIL